ncbi:GAF domain-containing protein [Frankia sp. AgB1.9]|uniref:helix-turn-helix domain-containing protein n=1 Tax=unclassified Frankia TaxID=2632575 RepID=UPI0019319377|nr:MULTISPECIES: PucR family transcriptional regulator [unclassified Frankia]MBL7486501.1 GAF domain-containing protein [Frankia sp. AgW1.1]MBL7552214.1 GAF domain-containing protein [Frankia sp. AgB1.9]MBL7617876.1 GAF domain-containing protein [Frankia sp. AgB1.8]
MVSGLHDVFEAELAAEDLARLPAEQALQVCIHLVTKVMRSDVASLYGFDADRDELTLIATRGLAHSGVGFVALRLGEGATGRAAQTGQAYAVRDVADDPHFKIIPGFDQSGFRSILAVPVVLGPALLGALNVQSIGAHSYTDDEINSLHAIAAQIAPLLARWHSDGDVARQLRGPKLLSYVDGMAAAALGPTELCERLVADLATVLPQLDCGVSLVGAQAWIGSSIEPGPGVTTVPLRGQQRECGVLALRHRAPGVPPWDNPPAWEYVRSIAEQFAIALEHALDVRDRQSGLADSETYDSLVAFVLDDRGLEELIAEVSRRAGAPVSVIDAFGTVLAGPELDGTPSPGRREVAIRAGDQQLGLLVADGDAAPALFETAAQVVALEFTKWRVGFEVETRLRGDLLELLLRGTDANRREVIPRASLAGLDLRRAYTPIMFAIESGSGSHSADGLDPMGLRSMVALVQHRLGDPPGSLVFPRADGLLVLLDAQSTAPATGRAESRVSSRAEAIRADLVRLRRGTRVGVGIGTPTSWPENFSRVVHTTVRAAEFALRMKREDGVSSSALGAYALLIALDEEALREYVRAHLGILLDQDAKSGGDLVATLEAYHLAGDRLKPAAEALFIHVNTMKYRIARIEALTDGALSAPSRRHDLYLALRALRVLDSERTSMLTDKLTDD